MNLLETVCKELGVKVGERWLANDGYYYKITEDGMIGFYFPTSGYEKDFDIDPQLWVNLATGDLKPVWKPKIGDFYWTIEFDEEDKIYKYMWYNGEAEQRLLKIGVVFKTKEEAIKVANKMINALKEEK